MACIELYESYSSLNFDLSCIVVIKTNIEGRNLDGKMIYADASAVSDFELQFTFH